ncbi:MAG: tRNA (adenosine(37)-N6)-threonylcarbamoyltransferase complex transferase subunit TsaD [Spirochaetales bacterium]|nr:tRNA (adenosine(37)-N6)-threonylcarbamoyltransferase complex transferase subunit TsaD [Spirochaetales bacterium]
MLVLGIESSCDETSIAIVRDGRQILSVKTYSQIAEHAPFQGVVPEIASRSHLEKINFIYESAMEESGVQPGDLSGIAVANRPGLPGSLLMGAQFARCLSLVYDLPIAPVDHVEAHFYAPCLEGFEMEYPLIGLLLSGGNSAVFEIQDLEDLRILADTHDDALGEAYDKCASMLGLGFPGGPALEALAARCDSSVPLLLPPLLREMPEPRFSFSGIKTAVQKAIRAGADPTTLAYSFQERTVELVLRVLVRCVESSGCQKIVAGGGVLANANLRGRLDELANKAGWTIVYPQSRALCTDNAAMVAALGTRLLSGRKRAGLDFPVSSSRST